MFKHGEFSHNGPLSGSRNLVRGVRQSTSSTCASTTGTTDARLYARQCPLVQVAGSHYKSLKIQPIEYIHANGIPFAEGVSSST